MVDCMPPDIRSIPDLHSSLHGSFFQELNSQLFRVMQDAASSEDHVLTVEMVNGLGLHPVKDRLFLTELASVHRFNVNVQRPQDMADLCSCCM